MRPRGESNAPPATDGLIDRSPSARAAARGGAIVCLLLTLAAYPVLSGRLAEPGGVRAVAFYLAYGLSVFACGCLVVRAPRLLAAVLVVVRQHPVRAATVPVNFALCAVVILFVSRYWGAILVMLLGACLLAGCLMMPDAKRREALDNLVRFSPVSFAALYACLVFAEVYFRFHPMQVGGGGGGNPALRRLYAGFYTENAFGLRGAEFSRAPPEGTHRILALGDSFTFGQGVRDAETYAAQLQALLNESDDECRYEVVNAGRRGVNTVRELRYLEREGRQLRPDLVTVQFYLNDLDRDHDEDTGQGLYDAMTRPMRRSYCLFFLRDRFSRLLQRRATVDWRAAYARQVAADAPGWRACAAAFDSFGGFSRDAGVPVAVILFPHPGPPHEGTTAVHQAVADRCRRAGLHVVDLAGAFGAVDPEEQIVSEIDHHPSALVHRIAAQQILGALREAGVLPCDGNPSRR